MEDVQSKTYIWIEDKKGKSSYTFWDNMLKQLYPDICLESKNNNSELVKAVKNLEDNHNKYIIIFDNSFDNAQVALELKLLKQCADKKDNVFLMDIICFEYILLEFEDLIKWIYAPDDEFLIKRKKAISAREKLIAAQDMNYKDIHILMEYDKNIHEHNIEQLSSKLLFELTRNTGFEVSKSSIGDCWIKSCCEWNERDKDDICGLDNNRMSLYIKMKSVYEKTSLINQFRKAGLEHIV